MIDERGTKMMKLDLQSLIGVYRGVLGEALPETATAGEVASVLAEQSPETWKLLDEALGSAGVDEILASAEGQVGDAEPAWLMDDEPVQLTEDLKRQGLEYLRSMKARGPVFGPDDTQKATEPSRVMNIMGDEVKAAPVTTYAFVMGDPKSVSHGTVLAGKYESLEKRLKLYSKKSRKLGTVQIKIGADEVTKNIPLSKLLFLKKFNILTNSEFDALKEADSDRPVRLGAVIAAGKLKHSGHRHGSTGKRKARKP